MTKRNFKITTFCIERSLPIVFAVGLGSLLSGCDSTEINATNGVIPDEDGIFLVNEQTFDGSFPESPVTGAALPPGEVVDHIALTPNNITNGQLPFGYKTIDFTSYNGDYSRTLSLPKSAVQGARVNFTHEADYPSYIDQSNTNFPGGGSLHIGAGQSISYIFNAQTKIWVLHGDVVSPRTVGAQMPNIDQALHTKYITANGNYARVVTLPQSANNNSLVEVAVGSSWSVSLSSETLVNFGKRTIKRGENYFFKYNSRLEKWHMVGGPTTTMTAKSLTSDDIPRSSTPTTTINFSNGHWRSKVNLPAKAHDRDKIILKSTATSGTTIGNDNVEFKGTMVLHFGGQYEFLYIAEKNAWVLQSHPIAKYNATDVNTQIPAMSAPVSEVQFQNGNWTSDVALPQRAKPGDRVILKSAATDDISVLLPGDEAHQTLRRGDTVSYTRRADGRWDHSNTIDALLVIGSNSVEDLGAIAMRARVKAGVDRTNEALENSGANLRLRIAGVMEKSYARGLSLTQVLNSARSDAEIQKMRYQIRADWVYVEGVFDGCGLGYINPTPNRYNMVGSGSTRCGTTVMRHEFGHNMGLNHHTSPTPTAMAGNSLPYFSTPHRFTQEGLVMGKPIVKDGVASMGKISKGVSELY